MYINIADVYCINLNINNINFNKFNKIRFIMTHQSESTKDPIQFDWEKLEKVFKPENIIIPLNELAKFPTIDDIKSIKIKISRCEGHDENSWSTKHCNKPNNNSNFDNVYRGMKQFLGDYFYCRIADINVWIEDLESLAETFGIHTNILKNAIGNGVYKTEITITIISDLKIVYEL